MSLRDIINNLIQTNPIMEDFSIITDLLFRFFLKPPGKKDEQKLDGRLSKSPSHRQILADFKNPDWFFGEMDHFNDVDEEASLNKLRQRLAMSPHPPGPSPARASIKTKLIRIAAAAVLIIIAGVGIYIYKTRTSVPPASSASAYTDATISIMDGPALSPTEAWGLTPGGYFTKVMPDGSTIRPNSATTIHYDSAYGITNRNVELSGEAYFEVKHPQWRLRQSAQPFVVTVWQNATGKPGLTAEVTGTRFRIRAYPEDSTIRTSLDAGTLLIKVAGVTLDTLRAGHEFVFNKNGTHEVKPLTQAAEHIAWKDDRYYFRNQPLTSVLDDLGRLHHVQFSYMGKITDTVSIQIHKSEDLSKILNDIRDTYSIHFDTRGDSIFVSH